MKINIDIDDRHEEMGINIQTREWTVELGEIVNIFKKVKQQHHFDFEED
ncbi:hypothetical protein [Oceanobacillus neutriphilus]|uniref:Uncharacterized protein n=1 Tax=Oceanobacillus neutriphilus TaxID=531815 RepID=A0ABQ2P2S2_9BACI|nr:hypothetical protein [Oceanobacillus neutriphilus]GGP16897.1 hypothetical protein GCM10011346_50690 [Oceanobacillus neutriphilus]